MSKFNFAISIVTLNNLSWCKKTLDTLLNSDIKEHDFSLYVFNNKNNQSDFDLYLYLKKLSLEHGFKLTYLIDDSNAGIVIPRLALYNQLQRDRRLQISNTNYLLEIHDDMIFPKNWINELLKYDDPKNAIISPLIYDDCYSMDNDNLDNLMPKLDGLYQDKIYTNIALSHPCITRLDILDKIGYYNPLFSPQMYEDTDLHCRLLDSGFNTIIVCNSIVFHTTAGTRDLNDNISHINNKKLFEENNNTTEELFLNRLAKNGDYTLPYGFMPILKWKYWTLEYIL